MSEQTSTAVAGEQNEQGQEAAKEFEAITSQEDFDARIQARIARERAKIPTDYEELKAKAEKYDGVVVELDQTKTKLSTVQGEKTRAQVAAAKGVPEALLAGSTQEEFEAAADALIAFRGTASSTSLHVPNEGNSPTGGSRGSSWSGVLQTIDEQRG
jgi:hypothetical protein